MKKLISKIKALSKETKAAIIVTVCSALFLGGVAIIGYVIGEDTEPVALNSSISFVPPSSVTSSITPTSSASDKVVDADKGIFKKPFNEEDVEIIRYFFDSSLPEDDPTLLQAMYMENGAYISSIGLDFATKSDETFSVLASYEGVVESITPNDKVYGNIVVIKHEDNIKTIYASLTDIQVKVGQEVKSGDLIGVSGSSTINSNYNHSLHFEVTKDDKHINPLKLFDSEFSKI